MSKEEKKHLQSPIYDIDKNDSEAIYRFYSVISFIVVLIGVGLPVWWFSTRVYRANLPLNAIYEFELKNKTDKAFGLPLSIEYDILITIVNPDPQNLKVNLVGNFIDTNLQPFLTTLSEVIDFTVKTQWLYLTELGVVPKKTDNYYIVTKEQLPHIITPLEKKLWSHISPRPCINLVLYIASCKNPLYILDEDSEKLQTNSFLSARWGGVSIINPNIHSCKEGIFIPQLEWVISTFINQLRFLLQIRGKSESNMKEFKLLKVTEMITSAKRTLKSLAQLLSEISSIVISDVVADKINQAVLNVIKAEQLLKQNDFKNALLAAKEAFINSEAAFSDPSLLALLYFPDDQKYAVYIPLFLPIMIPVVMSIFTIKRWYIPTWKTKLD
ncbi:hypothetical protein FQA39_LY05083 [Lamprigera yunnana]|nr:hypothetical protein FQA39_LY05083 [Lamprigera yunnana]